MIASVVIASVVIALVVGRDRQVTAAARGSAASRRRSALRCSARLTITVVGAATIAACAVPTQSELVGACAGTGWPAVVAQVRTDAGAPAAMGATLVVQDGAYVDSAGPAAAWDSLRLGAAENRAGTDTVRVSKPYDRTAEVHGVRVPSGPCGAIRATTVPVPIALLPGAPPVRSVVAYPTTGLGLAGITVPFYAYVDAAPGVPTDVTWSSTDTTVVTVSPAGVATSRCRTAPGEAAGVATSTVDPSKAGRAAVTVFKNADRCPSLAVERGVAAPSVRERRRTAAGLLQPAMLGGGGVTRAVVHRCTARASSGLLRISL